MAMSIAAGVRASRWVPRFGLNSAHVAFATLVFFSAYGANGVKNAFGWWTWSILVVLEFAIALTWLIRSGSIRRFFDLPRPLLVFWLFITVSLAWSQWRPETLLGAVIFAVTVFTAFSFGALMRWEEIIVGLSGALRWVLALSFLFELWVSLVIRHPVLPVWLAGDPETASLQLLWSRDLLFETGKIQGIVGNSSILAQVAAVALIALVVQFAIGRIGRFWGGFWLVVIVLTLVLTRSATMTIALVATAVVGIAVLIRRRVPGLRGRLIFWASAIVVAVVGLVAVVAEWDRILGLFGKDGDLTGRTEIWANTIALAVQRPWFGWGWLGYWPPWLDVLGHLNTRYGVAQLHAHNAWIDLWMQVGLIGLALFAILFVWVVVRAWHFAITPIDDGGRPAEFDHSIPDAARPRPRYRQVALLPILVVTLFGVQSLTESGILVQEGLFTFATIAIALARVRRR
jgi:O-antigen ligase